MSLSSKGSAVGGDEYCGLLLSDDFNCVDGFRCDMGGYGAVGTVRRPEEGVCDMIVTAVKEE